MKLKFFLFAFLFSPGLFSQVKPISLHPENAHYFLFRNKPTILITSAEHYGSVVNLDFDYIKYLDELKSNGLNYTRIFSGSYIETPGHFGITKNTLSPKSGQFICPWKRSNIPSYINGGNKFNLDKWDKKYFTRLKHFVSEAGRRGIVVEMTFFSSLYSDNGWKNSPLNGINNVNKIDSIARKSVQTLNNGKLLQYQESMVRKIVAELNEFDNVFYEIQNEPWSDFGIKVLELDRKEEGLSPWQKIVDEANPASLAWQKHMVSAIVKEEAKQKEKHLIAQNFTNFRYQLKEIDPRISILNFHYALPEAVGDNYHSNKVVGFDESGFSGNKDETYRRQAWRFIMAGGGLFNNLDYSFTPAMPDGSDHQEAPGGGSRTLRNQLKVLKDFMESFDFIKLKPVPVKADKSAAYEVYELSNPGKQYALYFEGVEPQENISVDLPEGNYQIELISVEDGGIKSLGKKNHKGGMLKLETPGIPDFALRIKNN